MKYILIYERNIDEDIVDEIYDEYETMEEATEAENILKYNGYDTRIEIIEKECE